MKKENNILLISVISFISFISLLVVAIYIDYKRGVFSVTSAVKSNKNIIRMENNVKNAKYKKNVTLPDVNNYSLPQKVSGAPSSTYSTKRKLEGDELLHSRAETAYYNYLKYSIEQNLPDMSNFSRQNLLWLMFDINKNGYVIAYDVHNSRGPKEFKEAILTAFKKTAPFQPLPDEYLDDTFKAVLVFSQGGRFIGQGSVYNAPAPQTKLVQARKANTLKVTDVKLASCNGSFPADLSQEMHSYIHKLHKQIATNWVPVKTSANDVRLSYVIDKNGRVSDVSIGYSKGPVAAEDAARNAILSIKAPKFPEAESLEKLRLNHYFDVKENKIYN